MTLDEAKVKHKELVSKNLKLLDVINKFKRNDPNYTEEYSNLLFLRTQLNDVCAIYGSDSTEAVEQRDLIKNSEDKIIKIEDSGIGSEIKQYNDIGNHIENLRQYCKDNFNLYEYHSSDMATYFEQLEFFNANRFSKQTVLDPNIGKLIHFYTFQQKFDEPNLEFIKNICQYLEPNLIIGDQEMRKFTFHNEEWSLCYCNDKWLILDKDNDSVFEDEDIQTVYQYFNMVR